MLCTVQCHPGHTCTNCKTSLAVEGSVDLTLKAPDYPQKTILKPSLSSEQKRILCSKAWLDDTMMDKGQALLKAQYPHINGLQSVILTEKYALIPQPDEFLQILNVNGNHWILLSTIGCPPATINVYDSLHGNLPPPAQRVVADLLQCKEANITIRYMDVQWRSNGYDCGLFALANATALCAGTDPTSVTLEQSKMRKHFLACLERNCLMPFPIRGQRRRVSPARIDRFSIYCVCRLTDDGSQMIQCNHCQEWFHTNCVRVARKYIHEKYWFDLALWFMQELACIYTGHTLYNTLDIHYIHYTQYYTHTTHYYLYAIYTLYYTLLCTASFVNVYKTLASWLRELRVVSLRQLSRYKLYRSIDLHLLQAGYIPAHKALCVLSPDQNFQCGPIFSGKQVRGDQNFH